jgi:hypothetical protein
MNKTSTMKEVTAFVVEKGLKATMWFMVVFAGYTMLISCVGI